MWKKFLSATLLSALALIPIASHAQSELAAWQTNMVKYGKVHCSFLKTSPSTYSDPHLAATYYDAQWIYLRIAAYTGDTATWKPCADAARKPYRDYFLLPNGGKIPGYWVFPHGLSLDPDTRSQQSLKLLTANGAFCQSTAYNDGELGKPDYARETAYCLMANLLAGNTRRAAQLKEYLFGYHDAWWSGTRKDYKPFMVGLTAQALIQSEASLKDSRTLPTLLKAGESMWQNVWVDSAEAMKYLSIPVGTENDDPAPDLNNLIAPMYAWLYKETGDVKWRDRGDKLFNGGMRKSFFDGAKQFNQNYRWSFDYVAWRNGSAVKTPGPEPTSVPTPTQTATPANPYTVTLDRQESQDVLTIQIPRRQ